MELVSCKFCHEHVDATTAHLHDGSWVGMNVSGSQNDTGSTGQAGSPKVTTMSMWSDTVESSWTFERRTARMLADTREQEAAYFMREARRCLLESKIARTMEHDHHLTPLEAAYAANALDEARAQGAKAAHEPHMSRPDRNLQ